MAVRLRMKQMGRAHRPFYRVCAMDSHTPRNGRVLEELGTYDPMVPQTDARAILNCERIDYWLGVGALPSEKVRVLIKKYGSQGTHREQQQAALDQLSQPKVIPDAGKPASMPKTEEPAAEAAPEAAAKETPSAETPAAEAPDAEVSTEEASAPEAETPATVAAEGAVEATATEGETSEAKEEAKEEKKEEA